MNLKNLFRVAFALVLLTFLGSTSFAQTTYYVNSVQGLDGYDGLTANVTGTPGQGPKKTIANAIAACSSGDIISVEANGTYTEDISIGDKKITFRSTGGTVNVNSITLNNTLGSGNNVVVFEGPYKTLNNFVLTAGNVVGASNVTVKTAFTRTFGTSVDAQLNYDGKIAFTYTGAGEIVTGLELPPAGNVTNLNNLNVIGGASLKLNEAKTVIGTITATGAINLNSFTLTSKPGAAAVTHSLGGHVTNGTLIFDDASQNITINETAVTNLPTVEVVNGHGDGRAVMINTSGTVGNVTVSGSYNNLTLSAASSVGNINNNSTGTATYGKLIVTAATTVGNVVNSNTGEVRLVAATTIGSITNSARRTLTNTGAASAGTGQINIQAAGPVTVNGDVLLNSEITDGLKGGGEIDFNGAVVINGNVTNSLNYTAAYTSANTFNPSNYGFINFDGAVTITGNVVNNANISPALTVGSNNTYDITFDNNGDIRFNAALNLVNISGKIINNSSASAVSFAGTNDDRAISFQGNGRIIFAATAAVANLPAIENTTVFPKKTGTSITYGNNGSIIFGANNHAVTVASVSNNSASETATNGLIDFGAGTGAVTVTGDVVTSGAFGGDIKFPSASFSVKNLYNQRTEAGADIEVGSAALAGATVTVTGDLVNSGKSKVLLNASSTGNVSIAGKLENSAAGSIEFPNLTSGTIGINTIFTVTDGTVDLGANASGNITVKNLNLVKGSIKLGTVARDFTVNGTSAVLGNETSAPSFTNGALTTLILSTPVPTNYQTLTVGAYGVIYPGLLTINNASGLVDAVTISGGNLRIYGNVRFGAGSVVINGMNQRLFIGSEVDGKAGNFTNASGYRTENNAFVSLNGNAAVTVDGLAGVFGNFEVDMTAGATINAGGAFKSVFNLTKGTVTATSVIFNNAASYPTIVRNAGTFSAAPTFTSMVNVYYIGGDKPTSLELPSASDKLNDLTVATTNGAVAGKGTVEVNVATTVNGTLTINANQALLISGVDVTMKGASLVVNGDLANVAAADELVLAKATGTAITGTGWLPDLRVAVGSAGNTIVGSKGLLRGLLGANKVRGVDDIDPTTASANAGIVYGAGNGALSVSFGAGAKNGSHVGDITTAHSGNSFTLAANLVQAGNVTHPAGTITVPENVVWTFRGTALNVTGGATPAKIMGAGSLQVLQAAGAGVGVTLTNTGAFTLDIANLEINLGATVDAFTVAGAALTLNSATTVSRGTLTMNQDVTVKSNALTVAANGAIAGGSILTLNATTAPLTFTYTGTPSISNLTVKNDVTLAGTGTSLTVTGAFVHDAGVLNFADRTLTINGTFARTAGTYNATTGYLVIGGGSFAKGTANFTIPNLKIASAGAFATTGAAVVTVTKKFDLDNTGTFTHKVGTVPTLALDNEVVFTYVKGDLDILPVYNGTMSLVLANGANLSPLSDKIWPAQDALVTNLEVKCAGFTATLPGSRKVNTSLSLTSGTVQVPTDKALTLADGMTINVIAGSVALQGGSAALVHGANSNVNYLITAGYGTGIELPATVNNFTVGRTGNVANSTLTLNKTVTINGKLDISNDFTVGAAGLVKAAGDVKFANASNSNASASVITFAASPLTFIGNDQAFELAGNTALAQVKLAQTGTSPKVTMTGGNLTITAGGNIEFEKGVLNIGANTLVLPTVVQGFTRTGTGHVFGLVQKSPALNFVGRLEYPVGTLADYRPVSITFLPGAPLITATNIKVAAVAANPGGNAGFPLTVNGVVVDTTAGFSWQIVSTTSLGPSQTFDIEFEGAGYTNYTNIADVRVINRLGNVPTNNWVGQNGTYVNYESGVAPNLVPVVRVTNSTGNLVSNGSTFTFGFRKPVVTNFAVSGTVTYDNAANTALAGVVVTLNPGGLTATTNATGAYSFANVANGTYTVTASTTAPWAGANSTDALLVAKNFAGMTGEGLPLTGLKLEAANVNNAGAANNTDALLILTRFGAPATVFAKGDWVFSNTSLTVAGAPVVHNIKALATGDVNGSNTLGLAKVSSSLTTDGIQKVNLKEAFEVPVTVGSDVNVGAMSLKFNYPAELVEFVSSSKFDAKAENGVITLAWADLSGKESFDVKENGTLFTLKFQPKESFKAGSKVDITMDAVSEIANKDAKVVNAMLKIAAVEGFVPAEFALMQNYPNPFNPTSTIAYDLPVDAKVNLVVFNSLGEEVATLVNDIQGAGQYKVEWNAKNMTSGIYFYRINVEAGNRSFVQTNKMILMK